MAAQSEINYESVTDFYTNSDVFITGGTGFVGKVLIEKLLRSCPDIGRIFVLMRGKRGKSIEARVDELVSCHLFDRLRKENGSALGKVVPVFGDITQPRLGMYTEDIERLSGVTVAFHLAASVRFDDPLQDAIKNNICSTYELFEMLKSTATALRAVVHVSTAYSNPENQYVEEKLYPPKYDWRTLVQAVDRYEPQTLDALMKKLSQNSPNTYTYTKGLAEQVCNDYRSEIPLAIVRPSVVLFTIQEPMVGWVDNFNGPTGMMVSAGLGITRTAYLPPKNRINGIPVDVVAKTIILAAWKRGTIDQQISTSPLPVYNSAVTYEQSMEYKEMLDRGKEYLYEVPFSRMLWVPGGAPTDWLIIYYLKLFLTMVLPAFLLDLVIKAAGQKPFLMKLQSKIHGSEVVLRYFVRNEWEFDTKQTNNLIDILDAKDRKTFGWYMPKSLTGTYLESAYIPIRRYLMKDSDETIPYAKRKLARLILAERIIQLIVCGLMVVGIWRTAYSGSL
ncbi:putative fatty acyl-CoA reductase CG5065 [Anopheles ziemanni]|uniref:putative fatty acyl-CoA reductase CG5065 n=1 Tax=Anopheles coustani TaxID=139045 RepID=UPI002658AC28|nr:putative fatty acyl-CoA reductase CG5065 [Anopheles coustani]XP_058174823.1 putative fatty acyl-CoA reductase CG5065 [Anopheles ziemanni]